MKKLTCGLGVCASLIGLTTPCAVNAAGTEKNIIDMVNEYADVCEDFFNASIKYIDAVVTYYEKRNEENRGYVKKSFFTLSEFSKKVAAVQKKFQLMVMENLEKGADLTKVYNKAVECAKIVQRAAQYSLDAYRLYKDDKEFSKEIMNIEEEVSKSTLPPISGPGLNNVTAIPHGTKVIFSVKM